MRNFSAGSTELTAGLIADLLDAARSQSRLDAAPPLAILPTAGGWLVRLDRRPGRWGRLTADQGGGRYAWRGVRPAGGGDGIDALAAYRQGRAAGSPGGRDAGAAGWADDPDDEAGVAAEANGRAGVPLGTVVWLENPAPPPGQAAAVGTPDPDGGGSGCRAFVAPLEAGAPRPAAFLARLTEEASAAGVPRYGYAEVYWDGSAFADLDGGRYATALEAAAAFEAAGTAGIAAGTVVVLSGGAGAGGPAAAPPMFRYAAAAAGAVTARLGACFAPWVFRLDLGWRDSVGPPTGGTFRLRLRSGVSALRVVGVTDAVAAAATAADLEAALAAAWGQGSATVADAADADAAGGGPWEVTLRGPFAGGLAADPVSAFLQVDWRGLEYGDDASPPVPPPTPTATTGAAWDDATGSWPADAPQRYRVATLSLGGPRTAAGDWQEVAYSAAGTPLPKAGGATARTALSDLGVADLTYLRADDPWGGAATDALGATPELYSSAYPLATDGTATPFLTNVLASDAALAAGDEGGRGTDAAGSQAGAVHRPGAVVRLSLAAGDIAGPAADAPPARSRPALLALDDSCLTAGRGSLAGRYAVPDDPALAAAGSATLAYDLDVRGTAGAAAAGTFRLGFPADDQPGYTATSWSAPLPATATAAQVAAALATLPVWPSLTPAVSGGPLPAPIAIGTAGTVTPAGGYEVAAVAAGKPAGAWRDLDRHATAKVVAARTADEQVLRLYDPAGGAGGRPDGGTFTLAFRAAAADAPQVTAALAWDAPWQDVVGALECLPAVGAGGVVGWGGPCPAPVGLRFVAPGLQGRELPLLEADGAALTSSAGPAPEPVVGRWHGQRIDISGGSGSTIVAFTIAGSAAGSLLAATATGAAVAALLANAVHPGYGIAGYGPAGGPWWVVYKGGAVAGAATVPAVTATKTAGPGTVTVTAADYAGAELATPAGTYSVCLGPQYRLDAFLGGDLAYGRRGGGGADVAGGPLAGGFTLTLNGHVSAALHVGSTAAQVATALTALRVAAGLPAAVLCSVSGGPLYAAPMYLWFADHAWPAGTPRTLSVQSLGAGAAPTALVGVSRLGRAGGTLEYAIDAWGPPTAGTWDLYLGGRRVSAPLTPGIAAVGAAVCTFGEGSPGGAVTPEGAFLPDVIVPLVLAGLAHDISAADLQAALRAFTASVHGFTPRLPLTWGGSAGTATPSSWTAAPAAAFQPYAEAVCTGGPLGAAPILVRVPCGPGAALRDHLNAHSTPCWQAAATAAGTDYGRTDPFDPADAANGDWGPTTQLAASSSRIQEAEYRRGGGTRAQEAAFGAGGAGDWFADGTALTGAAATFALTAYGSDPIDAGADAAAVQAAVRAAPSAVPAAALAAVTDRAGRLYFAPGGGPTGLAADDADLPAALAAAVAVKSDLTGGTLEATQAAGGLALPEAGYAAAVDANGLATQAQPSLAVEGGTAGPEPGFWAVVLGLASPDLGAAGRLRAADRQRGGTLALPIPEQALYHWVEFRPRGRARTSLDAESVRTGQAGLTAALVGRPAQEVGGHCDVPAGTLVWLWRAPESAEVRHLFSWAGDRQGYLARPCGDAATAVLASTIVASGWGSGLLGTAIAAGTGLALGGGVPAGPARWIWQARVAAGLAAGAGQWGSGPTGFGLDPLHIADAPPDAPWLGRPVLFAPPAGGGEPAAAVGQRGPDVVATDTSAGRSTLGTYAAGGGTTWPWEQEGHCYPYWLARAASAEHSVRVAARVGVPLGTASYRRAGWVRGRHAGVTGLLDAYAQVLGRGLKSVTSLAVQAGGGDPRPAGVVAEAQTPHLAGYVGPPLYGPGTPIPAPGPVPGRSEIQRLRLPGTSGNYGTTRVRAATFTWGGYGDLELDNLSYPDIVQARADALFGAGNVRVTGDDEEVSAPLDDGLPFYRSYLLWFQGGLARTPIGAPTVTVTLGGAVSPDWSAAVEVAGLTTLQGLAWQLSEAAVLTPLQDVSSYQRGLPESGAGAVRLRARRVYYFHRRADSAPAGADYRIDRAGLLLEAPHIPCATGPAAAALVADESAYTANAPAEPDGTVGQPVLGPPGGRFAFNLTLAHAGGVGLPYTAVRTNEATLEFSGGLLAAVTPAAHATFTGTFPTRDGRTVTVADGYIVNVA